MAFFFIPNAWQQHCGVECFSFLQLDKLAEVDKYGCNSTGNDMQEGGVLKTVNDIWEDLGALSEDELFHVITKLFALYEDALKREPEHAEARHFF